LTILILISIFYIDFNSVINLVCLNPYAHPPVNRFPDDLFFAFGELHALFYIGLL
jgi:hypothetical protein